MIGPALGGILGSIALRSPFWVSAGLSLANAAYGVFVLPESLPPERRARFDWKRANPVGSLMLLRRHPELLGIAVVLFLVLVAHEAYPSVFVLYTDYRYGWGPRTVGLALALVGIATAIVGAWLLRLIVPALGETPQPLPGIGVRRGGIRHLWPRPHAGLVLLRHPGGGAVGTRGTSRPRRS